MFSLTPRFSRINHVVVVLPIACLVTVLAGMIFVAARNNNGELPAHTLTSADPATKARIAYRFGQLPLSFEANKGQTDQAVKFLSHGPGYDLFLTANEAVLSLRRPQAQKSTQPEIREALRLKMIGANAVPRIEGRDELPGKVNYFAGNNPQKWRRNVPTYRKVHYADVYPGIDVVYYGNQRELEYDFLIAPGANPKLIKFSVEGAEHIRLDQKGNLLPVLKGGEVRLNKPFIYQLAGDGSRSEVKGSYQINGNEVRFNVRGADSGKPLVIDPVLSYSTFLGGNGDDQAVGIAVDAQGSAYVTGRAGSFNFPTTPGAFKTSNTGGAFITKLDPTGTTLVYSTFLFSEPGGVTVGGTPFTSTTAIAVDSAGNAHVTGLTTDPDFPVVNPLKTSGHLFRTTDGALNWKSTGAGLTGDVRSLAIAPNDPNTMYAATNGDEGATFRSTDAGATWTRLPDFGSVITLAVDPTNSSVVYVGSIRLFKSTDGGISRSVVNLPVIEAGVRCIVFDPSTPTTIYVGSDVGVFRSTDSGSTWTTLNNFDTPIFGSITALAIDPTAPSTIYAASTNAGLFKTTNGGSSWVTINNGLSTSDTRTVTAVVIDPFNSSILYALQGFNTLYKSTNGGALWTPLITPFPTINTILADPTTASTLYVGTFGGGVLKTTNGGASFTSVNTALWDNVIRVLVAHPSSGLYAGGSRQFLVTDAFVTKLNSTGSELLFSTYLGGSSNETGNDIAVDGSGNIYITGETLSKNFPTLNAFQSTASDFSGNAFVTKLNPAVPSYVFSTYLGGSKFDEAHSIAADPAGNVYVTGNTNSADFPLANAFQTNIGDALNGDAFVTKFNSNGSLNYSTYLGGNNIDTAFGIAVDVSGNAYVTGVTASTNFPTANPIQATYGGSLGDAFITKLNSQGSALVYSTYLGGSGNENGRGIAVDVNGNAYVTGFTSSFDFPVVAGALRTRSALFKSVDSAANWSNDNYGLKASSIVHVAVHPTQPAIVYAGTTLGVFRSTDAGKTWAPINNGLTGHFVSGLVIDPSTPTTLYVSAGTDFGSVGGVYKSTDGGNSWTLRTNGMTNVNLLSLAIDPVTPTTLYAGASGGPIYKTTDGAGNWAPSGNVPPFFPVWLAVDPHTPARVFAAESSSAGGVFRSIDSGATWQSVSVNQTGPHAGFVGVSPHTPGLVYAIANGNGLFKSVDGGDNWTSVRPQSRFGRVVFDPVSASTLYLVSTFEGLLKSTDNGQTWVAMNRGLTKQSATALAINPLRPATLYLASAPAFDEDAFVTKIDSAGSAFIYSTLIGGVPPPVDSFTENDEAFAIALDSAGNAYITGVARSPDFPATPNGFQPVNLGFGDSFITKLSASYIISGHVLEGSTPLSGAEVVLSDGATLTAVITDSDGSYEFSHLREGGSFTVSAAKSHFTMAPPSQSFANLNSNQTLDFTATATNASFFTISGQVTENGSGLSGITVTLSGSQSGLRITDNNGNYSFEVASGGNYTVTPSLSAFTFGPPSQTFNNLSAPQIANFAATRQSFVVTNANNHGTGSLREAITNANATPGADKIVFNIPGPGVKVINLLTSLPEITGPVVIDATTQPGYAGAPLIEIDGTNVPFASGLVITAGNTTVRGLAIGGFPVAGIVLRACDNNVIQGNHIGVDAAGSLPRPNNTGIQLSDSSNNVIGGTTAAARNVISGNVTHGVEIGGSGNIVAGNFIGTNAAGTAAIGNGSAGIKIPFSSRTNNLIGGNSAGAGNLISGNVTGIDIESPGNTIQGNLIGTDATGFSSIHNLTGIDAKSPDTLIGGLTLEARNIISGNGTGVSIRGNGSKLQGNFIGTDIFGIFALGNSNNGVVAGDNALIGGTTPEARNVISANSGFGNVVLGLSSFGPGVTVQGNYIGTDASGTQALSESTVAGIVIFSSNNLIGGLTQGAQNVISGNGSGIQLGSFSSGPPQGNVIHGNFIGLSAVGNRPVPNISGGIEFFDSFNNTVGGTQSGAANKIAFNGGAGVGLFRGARNSVRGNSIFSNAGLGIDLEGADGVTANDSTDSDVGANNLQNFPVLTSVTSIGNSTTIQGSLNSTPNETFQIDFYSSAALDPSGNGEGALFFDTTSVNTDGNGDATINVTVSKPLGTGRVVTATATDSNGNTSEFSAGDATGAAGNLQFSVDSITVNEDVGFATVTVLRKGGSVGSLTVEYTSTSGTATAGVDYVPPFGFLNFSSGETSKSFQIPIAEDVATEPDETFTVQLNAGNPETLGAPISLVVTIQDRTTDTAIIRGDATVVEGDAGTTTEALFTFTLSAATGRTVTANYGTEGPFARASASCSNQGTDYETASGTIVFQPRVTSVTVPVKICGDANAESTEPFFITLSNPSNAVIGFPPQGTGTIFDDDVLELLRDDSGPTANQAAALDSFLMLRDPFRVVGIPEWFTTGADRNTRVTLFARGLQLDPGELPRTVVVRLARSISQFFDVRAEDVRAVPNVDFTQVVIRLPDNIPADTYAVTIRAHGRTSNVGSIRIAP